MKTTIIYSLIVGGLLATGTLVRAEHDKNCKNVHGKVTVVTENGITVNDKLYKVGDSTRITKDGKKMKLQQLSPGDIVCVDTRGEADIGGGEVAAVTILNAKNPATTREREYVREKETGPTEAAPYESHEVIREKEKVREEK